MTTWATAEDVLNVTGVDVTLTPSTLAAAESDISMHTGVLTTAIVFDRDAEWLRQAVAWQAAWLAGQPGNEQRSSVTSVSQDGLSVTYQDPTAVVLAPRARRCIKNLSWMGTRSVRVGPQGPRPINNYETVDPPDHEWSPIGTGCD